MVREFVRPAARMGVVVSRPAAVRSGAARADLEVLVLPDADGMMKRPTASVLGNAVRYRPPEPGWAARASVALDGLEIGLDFAEPGAVTDVGPERLGEGWVVHGADVVERWRGAGVDGEP